LKEVHGLVAKKAKWLGRPSIFEGGPPHQGHAQMNDYILGNAMVVQRQNDLVALMPKRNKSGIS